MKDKKACVFYFLMTAVLFSFGVQLRKISFYPYSRELDNPIFSIFHVYNSGSAFGMFSSRTYLLAFLGIIVLSAITYVVIRKITFNDKLLLLSTTLFCAGTLGNLVERIKFNYVIDYIKLNFVNFPVFNAFDIMICLSLFLYFISIILEYKKAKK